MGYWVGMTAKSGKECNFYVEDEDGNQRFYNGKDKKHEYMNCEPYDMIKDHTIKPHQQVVEDNIVYPLKKIKPEIAPEIKEANVERFKYLVTGEGTMAKSLLSEGKLNHTSFTKAINNGSASLTQKKQSKEKYDLIIKELLDNDIAEKKGLNYVYK